MSVSSVQGPFASAEVLDVEYRSCLVPALVWRSPQQPPLPLQTMGHRPNPPQLPHQLPQVHLQGWHRPHQLAPQLLPQLPRRPHLHLVDLRSQSPDGYIGEKI